MSFTNDILIEYCEEFDYFVTYVLIDLLLNIAYDEYFIRMINHVSVNNENVFLLEDKLNNVIDSNNDFDFFTKTVYLYKLIYKIQHFQTNHN